MFDIRIATIILYLMQILNHLYCYKSYNIFVKIETFFTNGYRWKKSYVFEIMFIRSVFLHPFDTYERVSGVISTNVESVVKKIAENETRSSLYDLGTFIAEKQINTYNIYETQVQFRVNELYGDKVLRARISNDADWTFITKFDCN